jgi:hypothetical protein
MMASSKAHMLRCASSPRHCDVHPSTPHSSGLARLASGAFYFAAYYSINFQFFSREIMTASELSNFMRL